MDHAPEVHVPLPADEAGRVAALRALAIVGTPREDEFDLLTAVAAELCGAPYAFVSLVDASRIWVKSAHGIDVHEESRCGSPCALAILQRDVLEIADLNADPRTAWMQPGGWPYALYAGARLLTGDGHAIGTLCVVDTQRRELTPRQRGLLTGLARQAMQLIELRAARRELERAAATDPLTGLANRRALLTRLREESERCARHGAGFAVVLIDLDRFKAINDLHGHEMGDTVLVNMAGLLGSLTRTADVAARYGGEEFCVLLAHTDLVGARVWAEHLRQRLAEAEHHAGQTRLHVTASFGVAAAPAYTQPDVPALLRAADSALYRAKQAGRDRVELDL